MTDIEPFSKSQQKQNAKDITDLGNQLAQLSEVQLSALPYPEIEAAIKEYKRITKGNARKRQMLYIGKLLRQVDLAAIEDLIDRYDSSSDAHRLLIHQFESWRLRLLASDPLVITELGERYSALDRQALRTIVRDAQAEQAAVAQPLQEELQRLRQFEETVCKERYGPSWNGKATDVDIIDNLTRLSPLAVHYNANVTNQFIRDIPEMLWWQKILQPFLNLEDLSILRRTNTFFQSYWVSVLRQNVIRVPQGCPTVEKAMALAVVFSAQKVYTETDPLKIQMDQGVHEIVGNGKVLNVTCSHITFVGKGKDQTTIRGGFKVENQQNVKFEELTLTNPGGSGLYLTGSETNVDMLKCSVKECGGDGMYVDSGATVTATQCEFMENGRHGVLCVGANTKARLNDCTMHHNGREGLIACDHAVVDLHGTKTDIHSNKQDGISASNNAKVNIHLPSQHNTSHDNVGEDRFQEGGGSIANINADGTFTHVVVEEEDDY